MISITLSQKIKGSNFDKNNSPYPFSSNRGPIDVNKYSIAFISIQNSKHIFIHSITFSLSSFKLLSAFLSPKFNAT